MTLCERIIQHAADAIVVASPNGTITLWNPAAERLFGFAAGEAIGKSLDLIILERHRTRHWAGYKEVMRTGTTQYGTQVLRVPAIRKDGSTLSIAFTVGMLKAADGRVEGNTEGALRQKVAEREKAAGAGPGARA
ncbi:MAG: PAS domain S-box protein [candidate division NC10 bacterium]|nr:PAS domain S-box protein [candidate division NC10 bacterium]